MSLNWKPQAGRALVLTFATLSGVGIALLVQQVHGQGEQSQPQGASTVLNQFKAAPIVSIAEARKTLPFPLFLPRELPVGATLVNARVTHIFQLNPSTPEEVQAKIRENSRPMQGFGAVFRSKNDRIMARSLGGSPAEAAGLSTQELELVSWDGIPAGEAYSKFRQLTHQEPMVLVVKTGSGGERTITIAHPGEYMFHPDTPPMVPQDNYAIVYISTQSSGIALQESPQSLHGFFLPPIQGYVKNIDVSGKQVVLTGSPETPSAYWTDAGVDYKIDNHTNAVKKQDVLHMIASMQKSDG